MPESQAEVTYMGIQEPSPRLVLEYRRREEQDDETDAYQDGGPVQKQLFPVAKHGKVDPEENSKEGEEKGWEFSHLLPVQVVSSIQLEDEGVVDLVPCPYPAVEGEQGKEQEDQEVAPI